MLAGQPQNKFLSIMEAALAAIATPINMDLFTNSPTLTVNSIPGDFTLPTYTGYAAVVLTPGTLRRNANGDYILPLGDATFQPTGNTGLPQTANGYLIHTTISSVDTMLMAEYFETPFVFVDDTRGFDATLEWIVPNATTYGGLCTMC